MSDQLLTARELAAWLRISTDIVYELVADGRIPGVRVGGQWRFDRERVWSALSQASQEDDAA